MSTQAIRPHRQRPRALLCAVTAGATLAAGLVAAPATAAPVASAATAPPVASRTAAAYGAGYLARRLVAGGGQLGTPESPDVTDTAYAVVALHAAGVGRAAARQATTFLTTQLGDALRDDDGTDDPGRLGYVILAAVADGRDPHHFGGTAPANDLVARLAATRRTTGADAGLLGTGAPTFDGAFRQGIALTALRAAGVPAGTATVTAATAWLATQQCANGLWQAYRADPTVACPTADPATFRGPDTNSTGMAVQGLAAYGQRPRRAAVLASLAAVRSADGGFGFLAAPGQSSDPNSTALVIQALLADGGQPGAAYPALAAYQLGCADPTAERGAFFYPGSRSANILATIQAVPAAAGATVPLRASRPADTLPTMACGAAPTPLRGTATAPATVRPLTGTAGPCSGTTGVTVTVDFTAFGGVEETRCAAGAQATGLAALQNAGFTPAGTTRWGLAFICRINALPTAAAEPCSNTPPATAYWAYYHALTGATTWTYSTLGASSYAPPQGSIEAWAFGNSATPGRTPAQVRAGL